MAERIALAALIAELRHELAVAQAQGAGQHPRLRIEEAEIEYEMRQCSIGTVLEGCCRITTARLHEYFTSTSASELSSD